jgi:hypothetical protein
MMEESEDEFEDVLVYVHFPDLSQGGGVNVPSNFADIDVKDIVMKDVHTSSPRAEINGLNFQGSYMNNLGTQHFFSIEKPAIEPIKKESGQEMLDRLAKERDLRERRDRGEDVPSPTMERQRLLLEQQGSIHERTNVKYIGMTNTKLSMDVTGIGSVLGHDSTEIVSKQVNDSEGTGKGSSGEW